MSKSTKILIGVLVILGIIYAIQQVTFTTSTTQNSNPFAKIDTSKIVKISVDYGRRIVIDREAGQWTITSPIHFPAAVGQVNLLLSRVGSNPSATVVADNMSDSSAYGLSSSSPLLELAEANGKSVSVRVGDVSPGFGGCYVRLGNERKVLELSTNIRTLVGQSLSNWRDKQIFSFPESDVEAMDFTVGDTLYNFFHRDTVWQVNGTDLPEMRVDDVLGSLVGTTALGFIDSTVNESRDILNYGITLSNKEHLTGKIFTLAESKGSFKQTCLSNSANHQVYIVSSMLPTTLKQTLRAIHRSYLTK